MYQMDVEKKEEKIFQNPGREYYFGGIQRGDNLHTQPEYSTTIGIFAINVNPCTINIPNLLRSLVGVRVRHVTWFTPPFATPTSNTLFWVSSPDVYNSTANQSFFTQPNAASPFTNNQTIFPRAIIGTFPLVLDTLGNLQISTYNPIQTPMFFNKQDMFNQINFLFESDFEGTMPITPTNRVNIALDLYLDTLK